LLQLALAERCERVHFSSAKNIHSVFFCKASSKKHHFTPAAIGYTLGG
jgi:hypothetical protein